MKIRYLSVVGLCFLLMVGLSWEAGAFSESDLRKLKGSGGCFRCDLIEANLSLADLTEASLFLANLTGAIFCKTKMPDGTQNNSGC